MALASFLDAAPAATTTIIVTISKKTPTSYLEDTHFKMEEPIYIYIYMQMTLSISANRHAHMHMISKQGSMDQIHRHARMRSRRQIWELVSTHELAHLSSLHMME